MPLTRARASLRNTALLCRHRLAAGRLILFLLTATLAVMPITERLWSWDAFILSGHDLEFSLIGLLTICGLCVLIAHQVVASPLFLLVSTHFLKAPPGSSLLTQLLQAHAAAVAATMAGPPPPCPTGSGRAGLGLVALRI